MQRTNSSALLIRTGSVTGLQNASSLSPSKPPKAKRIRDWQRDSTASHCVLCSAEFTTFNRRHHCRACGKIFCHFCSSKHLRMLTPESGMEQVRVCDSCHANHQMAIMKTDRERADDYSKRGGLNHLTNKMLLQVLNFLSFDCLLHIVALVNRDLYFCSHSNSIWKGFYEAKWNIIGAGKRFNWAYFLAYQRQYATETKRNAARLQYKTRSLLTSNLSIILLGSQGCGKTCLVQRFITGKYSEQDAMGTIGVTRNKKVVRFQGGGAIETTLMLFDCGGNPRYKALIPLYLVNVRVVCIVYDTTNPESFQYCQRLCEDLSPILNDDVVIAVCGLKKDLEGERQVTADQTYSIPFRHDFVYECSAKTNENVTAFFEACIQLLVKKFATTNTPLNTPTQAPSPLDILLEQK